MPLVYVKQYRDFGFYLDDFASLIGDLVKVRSTTTTATVSVDGSPNVRLVLKGTGFKFDGSGKFISGIITEAVVEATIGGKLVKAIELSSFTLDVQTALSNPVYQPFAGMGINYDGSAFVPGGLGHGISLVGTSFADTIIGSSVADELYGMAGNDTIRGGAGDDAIVGGGGNDKLYGDAGNDVFSGGHEAVRFFGGSGNDTVDYYRAMLVDKGITASLDPAIKNTGLAAGDTYSSIENLQGTDKADKLYGSSGNNKLSGWDGDDTLSGGAGDDVLYGWQGADKLTGGAGNDTAAYSLRFDADFTGTTSDGKGVTADLDDSSRNTGDAKGDTYSSIENLTGSTYSDKLYGNSKANILTGSSGHDTLDGRGGNDTLIGGSGADKLYGGTGADKFVFLKTSDSTTTARDTIYKFSRTQGDKIDLAGIDANTKASGNQAFSFVGTKAFSGQAGELRYEKADGGTYLHADVNGDKKIDFSVFLDSSVTFAKSDFIL